MSQIELWLFRKLRVILRFALLSAHIANPVTWMGWAFSIFETFVLDILNRVWACCLNFGLTWRGRNSCGRTSRRTFSKSLGKTHWGKKQPKFGVEKSQGETFVPITHGQHFPSLPKKTSTYHSGAWWERWKIPVTISNFSSQAWRVRWQSASWIEGCWLKLRSAIEREFARRLTVVEWRASFPYTWRVEARSVPRKSWRIPTSRWKCCLSFARFQSGISRLDSRRRNNASKLLIGSCLIRSPVFCIFSSFPDSPKSEACWDWR